MRWVLDYSSEETKLFSHALNKHLPVREVGGLLILNILPELEEQDGSIIESANFIEELLIAISRDDLWKLHKNYGHLGTDRLVSILQGAGAGAETIKHARLIQGACSTCAKTSPAPTISKIGGITANRRGDIFVTDLIYPKFRGGQIKHCVLHCVDVFSRYQRAYVLYNSAGGLLTSEDATDEKLKAVRKAFGKLRNDMGNPGTLMIDGDGLLKSIKQFKRDRWIPREWS